MNKINRTTRKDKKSIIDLNGEALISVVYTAPTFAKKIIDHFRPQFHDDDTFLDPCRGKGAFYENLPDKKDWCEIQDGKDFLTYDKQVSWIITNPPWRGKLYTAIARKSFELADNVVFLVKTDGAFGTSKRLNDFTSLGHQPVEILPVSWKEAGFYYQDGSAKDPEGFTLAVFHWKRGAPNKLFNWSLHDKTNDRIST